MTDLLLYALGGVAVLLISLGMPKAAEVAYRYDVIEAKAKERGL